MIRKLLPLADFMANRYAADEHDVLYAGASGMVMRASHRLMERGVSPEQNERVLDIGGGAMPHFAWMNAERMKSYTLSDRIRLHPRKISALKAELPQSVELLLHDIDGDPSIGTLRGPYTRIIASHVLEHIQEAEEAIVNWADRLTPEGVLSIALPCDPGWFWRLGQMFAFRGYGVSLAFAEYDLLMSREHVTSVQRVLKIVRYYFARSTVRWFPALLPVVDFNLICSITVRAADRRT